MLLELLRPLSGCFYLFMYAYDVKTASIWIYQVLMAEINLNFTFPILRHPKIGFSMPTHIFPGTGIWRYKIKFEGTPFESQ